MILELVAGLLVTIQVWFHWAQTRILCFSHWAGLRGRPGIRVPQSLQAAARDGNPRQSQMTEQECFHRVISQDSEESIVLPILGILVLDSKVLYNFLQAQEHQATYIIATLLLTTNVFK